MKINLKLSISMLWLFALSGIIGILSPASDWFLALTPLNLLLSFLILVVNIKSFSIKTIPVLFIPFCIGFIAEALGVNYGLIFGNYSYGENLGFKFLGVPLIICLNWAMLTAATADLSRFFVKNIVISSLISGFLMTILDIIIEVSAPRFDFWEFEGGEVPIQNYLGWFFTAFLAHLGYQYFELKTNKTISWHIFLSIFVFFTVFLFF